MSIVGVSIIGDKLRIPEYSYAPDLMQLFRNRQKFPFSVNFADATSNLKLNTLPVGKYKIKVYATCKTLFSSSTLQLTPAMEERLKWAIDENEYLSIYYGDFEVKEPRKTKAFNAKANDQYVLINGSFKETNGVTTSITNTNTTNNTYYNSLARYNPGTYIVTATAGLNTRKLPSATSTKITALKYNTSIEVTATDGNWGYTNKGWICWNYTRYVAGSANQVYTSIKYNTGTYIVSAHDGLKYRSGPNTGYSHLGSLKYNTKFNVSKVDGSWGYSDELNGWLCLNYASYVSAPVVPPLPVPETPELTSVTSSEIAVGDLISVEWGKVDNADYYTASLIDANSKKVLDTKAKITNPSITFATPYAGAFDVSVVALNEQQSSAPGYISGITAKSPSTVTFKDWDGSTIYTQEVAYGRDATLPTSPTRTGYTFKEWVGNISCIRENTTVTALYTKNSYNVNFYDFDGKLLNSQKVFYQEAAKAPSYSVPTGYSFIKWDTDFSSITKNTDVKATIQWTSAYSLEISTSSNIYRNGKTYITTAIVNKSPYSVSNAKVIVALKTTENKQLAEVSSGALSLNAGEMKTVTLSVDYDNGAATQGEIFVVQADNNNIPLANSLKVTVDQGTAWSQWSTSTPPNDALKTESRSEYRTRTKSYTTSTDSNLSGWTKYNTTSAYSNWSGWSAWQDAAVTANDLREVKTQTVQDTNNYTSWSDWSSWSDTSVSGSDLKEVQTQSVPASYKTIYHYYYYSTGPTDGNTSYQDTNTYGHVRSTVTFESELPTAGSVSGHTKYKWSNHHNTGKYMYVYADSPYTTQEVASYKTQYRYRTRSYATKTQYSYRTRTLDYTYYYYKWSDWSGWTATAATATNDLGVETRTTYRYISNIPANVEDKSGTSRTIKGNIAAQFAGKFAILHVVDSKGTTQFLGQTKIANDGSYSYTFKLKNEPSVLSGNYSVLLSIEGSTAPINLDPILAPIPKYTVTFKSADGTTINTQTVEKGKNAVAPEVPKITGYDFIGWDKAISNIQSDMTITAIFEKQVFDVVFVDEISGTTVTTTFNYGDKITAPAIDEIPEAYNFIGWDAIKNGITTVEDNMVINAVYEKKTYNVIFYDYDNNKLDTYIVEHGDGVAVPTLENTRDCIFIDWDTDIDFNYVTQDATVIPIFEYTSTVDAPSASIETGSYNEEQTITLSCATPGATIYYTTDSTDPLEEKEAIATYAIAREKATVTPINGTLYTGPFTLDSSANLVYVAVKDGMNSSTYEEEILAINTDSTIERKHLVTIHTGIDDYDYSILVNEGNTLDLFDENYYGAGYTLTGVYTDNTHKNNWNLGSDIVTSSMDIYLAWEKNTYEVTFLNKDDNTISIQQVAYLDSADAPIVPEVDGYVFSGWDTNYTSICDNTTLKATYIANDELTSVSLSKSTLELKPNQTSDLVATVSLGKNSVDDHVIWQSSNEDIATVDDSGHVTAIADGEATIFAVSEDSGDVAVCEVSVYSNCKHEVTGVFTPPTCTEQGYTTFTCSKCGYSYKDEYIPALGHYDDDSDGYCDSCDTYIGNYEPDDPSALCSCNCHKKGIVNFFWKLINFFHKIFGMKQYRYCDCGNPHW